jgi:RHS repeat-associated protein
MTSMVDARGNTAGANPADYTTSFSYDAAGNQIQVVDPLGLVTKQVFDRVGNVSTATNAKNLNTTYLFDTLNRVTRVTAPVVGATSYAYSNMGYVTSRTDSLSTATVPRVATWAYDLGGRLLEKKDAAGRAFTYEYDIAGNQTKIVDANANAAGNPALGSTTFTYDRLNRMVQRSYSDGTPTVSYTFDPQGRRDSMTDGVGTTTYGFDSADRMITATRGSDVWAYTYDAAGNVLSRQVPGGANTTASFDDAGQMISVADSAGSTGLSYDAVGNPIQMSFANGVTQQRTFDRASRLSTIVNAGPQGPIGGFSYVRDANGNPTSVDVSEANGVVSSESTRHSYDNADRLTKTCYTTGACTSANQTVWTYNKVGSRLTQKVGTSPVTTYTYDVADQLVAVGAQAYTYNANGDRLSVGPFSYTYNTARQTNSEQRPNGTATFTYDGNGNRATISNTNAPTYSPTLSSEVWDTVGGLPTLVAERDVTGVAQRKYTYVGSTPLKFDAAGATAYYLTDSLGSVSNLTTSSGAVQGTYRYDSFGGTRLVSIDPTFDSNPMRFTGQQQDPVGNYNLRARFYNPSTGTFTQTDPMPYGAGSAFEGAHVYGGARPTVMTDLGGKRFGPGLGQQVGRGQSLVGLNPNFISGFGGSGCYTGGGKPSPCPPKKNSGVVIAIPVAGGLTAGEAATGAAIAAAAPVVIGMVAVSALLSSDVDQNKPKLYRYGPGPETTDGLQFQAETAAKNPNYFFGVSTNKRRGNAAAVRCARQSDVELLFPGTRLTGNPKGTHVTVALDDPVTDLQTTLFNSTFLPC